MMVPKPAVIDFLKRKREKRKAEVEERPQPRIYIEDGGAETEDDRSRGTPGENSQAERIDLLTDRIGAR